MHAIDELIKEATEASPGTVIHVGAGRGAVLEQYARLQPSRVVLVEGDPDSAQRLERAARPFPWAHVVAQAVAAVDGPLTWHRYNLPALNGPMAVDALARDFPRLQREASVSVPGVALDRLLCAELQAVDGKRPTLLVLDVPGQEVELVESLGDALKGVTALVIRRCASPMPGASTWASLVERLRELAFDLVGQEAEQEPLWPVAVFRFDARGHALRELQKQRDGLQLRVTQGEDDLAGAKALAKAAATAHAEEEAALKLAAAAAEKLAGEREAVVQQLTKVRDEQAKQVEVLTQGKAAAEQLSARNAAASDDTSRKLAKMEREVASLMTTLSSSQIKRAETEAQLEEARKTAVLAVRGRAVSDGDLRDLQLRFARLLSEREASRSAMQALADRIELARQYYEEDARSQVIRSPGSCRTSRQVTASTGKGPVADLSTGTTVQADVGSAPHAASAARRPKARKVESDPQ